MNQEPESRNDRNADRDADDDAGDGHCPAVPRPSAEDRTNFVELAEGGREWTNPKTRATTKDKLYDGTIFHRVIPAS